jgi:YegS/Rv2252/BmrU family lipid kinase
MTAERTLIILNPAAGRGSAAHARAEIVRLLQAHGVPYTLQVTQRPGHAVELAANAAEQGYQVVAAAGGDGTVNEVINGLLQPGASASAAALAILPVGRGNDFCFSMGLPMRLQEAVASLRDDGRRRIDVARLTSDDHPAGRFVGNGIGVGFDALVSYQSTRLPVLRGFANYLVSVLISLIVHFRAPLVRLTYDGITEVRHLMMVSVMNGRRLGGGFLIAPHSQPDDGRFDLSIIRKMSRPAALGLLPRFMNATHIGHPAVATRTAGQVEIEALAGALPMHGDGEVLSLAARWIRVEVARQALGLVTPKLAL